MQHDLKLPYSMKISRFAYDRPTSLMDAAKLPHGPMALVHRKSTLDAGG